MKNAASDAGAACKFYLGRKDAGEYQPQTGDAQDSCSIIVAGFRVGRDHEQV